MLEDRAGRDVAFLGGNLNRFLEAARQRFITGSGDLDKRLAALFATYEGKGYVAKGASKLYAYAPCEPLKR